MERVGSGQAIAVAAVVVGLVGGLFLTLWGLFGPWKAKAPRAATTGSDATGEMVIRIVTAFVIAVTVFLFTGWPVAALFGFGAGFAWLSSRKEAKRKAHELAQTTALATWIESLKDTMAASAGITEALTISGRIAPKAIEPEVDQLLNRMRTEGTGVALQRFAADIANPAADMIVAALSLALTKQAGSLQGILAAVAKNARDYATMLQQVEAGRTEVRTQSKLAVAVIGSIMIGMILLRRDSLRPFDTLGGQVALLVICGLFALAGVLLYRLGKADPPQRVFRRVEFENQLRDEFVS